MDCKSKFERHMSTWFKQASCRLLVKRVRLLPERGRPSLILLNRRRLPMPHKNQIMKTKRQRLLQMPVLQPLPLHQDLDPTALPRKAKQSRAPKLWNTIPSLVSRFALMWPKVVHVSYHSGSSARKKDTVSSGMHLQTHSW